MAVLMCNMNDCKHRSKRPLRSWKNKSGGKCYGCAREAEKDVEACGERTVTTMPRLIDADAFKAELIKWRDNDTHRKSRSLIERWVRRTGINVLIRVIDAFPSMPYEPAPRWIPVTERPPDLIPCNAGTAYSEAVIVWTDGRKAMVAVWDGTDFLCAADYWEAWDENITHWIPLSKPPENGGSDER